MQLPFWSIMLPLLFTLTASSIIFVALNRRWTTGRDKTALREWARGRRLTVGFEPAAVLPAALEPLTARQAVAEVELAKHKTVIARIRCTSDGGNDENHDATRWNVLVREVHGAWPPTGLRPVGPRRSLLDLFQLSEFPAVATPDRFLVVGTELPAARVLAKSSARGLLPPDVGLLLHGSHVTLDFTARPFDPIEFDRMIAVMEQLVNHLPAGTAT